MTSINATSTPDCQTEILVKYVQLRAELKRLEDELQDLYPRAVEVMKGSAESVVIGDARLIYRTRNTYKFSSRINEMSENVRLLRKHEIETGIATVESVKEFIYLKLPG